MLDIKIKNFRNINKNFPNLNPFVELFQLNFQLFFNNNIFSSLVHGNYRFWFPMIYTPHFLAMVTDMKTAILYITIPTFN